MANIGSCLDEIQPELSDRSTGNILAAKTAYSSESSNRFEWQFRHTAAAALTSYCWLGGEWEILIGSAKYQ